MKLIGALLLGLLSATEAVAGCAKFSCVNTDSGRCHFVVFRNTAGEARFALAQWERRWIADVNHGDTYCATLRNQPGEACRLLQVRDIKPECPPVLVSRR